MIKISNEEAVILGLLYEHHHYAHRIKEIMRKRGIDEWTNTEFSSVDKILKEMEENNLVECCFKDVKNSPSSPIYYITDEGRFQLKRKIKKILEGKNKVIYPFDLGLANLHILGYDEIIQSLEIYLKSIEERIHYLEHSIKVQEENKIPYNFIAIYSRSVPLLKAEKKWIEEFMEQIKLKEIK
jgi:DNA-binding PadR family transcriptional regulator